MLESLRRKFPRLRQFGFGRRFPRRGALSAGIACVLAGLVWYGFHICLSRQDWASWVQAIGSIAAVGGAWAVGSHQAKQAFNQALRLRDIDREDRVRAIKPIALRATELIHQLDDEPVEDYLRSYYSEGAFRHCRRALDAIPLHELGRFGLVEGYLELQEALEAAERAATVRNARQLEISERWRWQEAGASDAHVSGARKKADAAMSLIESNSFRTDKVDL